MLKALTSVTLALSLSFGLSGAALAKDKKAPEQEAKRVYAPVNFNLNEDRDNILLLDLSDGQRVAIRLMPDWAPNHVARIKELTRQGFYNGLTFHRVIDGFMAQTGDGQNGDGSGGSKLPDLRSEFSSVPFRRGIVGMARKGGNNHSANSQFFIMFAEQSSLNNQYTVVGEVVSGMDVVDKLNKGEPPRTPDRIRKATVK